MLGTDIVVVQATSFIDGQLYHLFGTRRQTDLAEHNPVAAANDKLNGTTNLVQFNAEVTKYFCCDTFSFAYKAKEQMFCPDVIVLEALRFLLCKAQDPPGPLCELVKPIFVVHLFVTPLSVAEGGTEPSVSLR